MVYTLRAIFLGKKILIISDQEFLFNHIKNFFKNVTEDTFDFDLNITLEMEYKKNIDLYNEHIVFKNREVVKDNKNIINPKELEFEKQIVQKFLVEYDLMAGLIILRNEIKKVHELSKDIVEFIQNNEESLITSKKIIKYLSEKHQIKIQLPYFKFLLDVVQNYFKIDVPKMDGVSNLLGLL
jgi:hypothetical protein